MSVLQRLHYLTPLTWLATATAAIIAYVTFNLFLHPLSKIPGPFFARSGLFSYRAIRAIKRDASWKFDELHDVYGEYVRIGVNEVMTTDPAGVRELYGQHSKWNKTGFYRTFRLGPPKGIMSETDAKKHATLRRLSSGAYSMNALVELEGSVDQLLVQLHKQLDAIIAARAPWDAGVWLQWFAMDTVGLLAFGRDFGLVRTASDPSNLLPSVDEFIVVAAFLGLHWRIGDPFFTLAGALGAGGSGAALLRRVTIESVSGNIERAKQLEAEGGDQDEHKSMLTRFRQAIDPHTGKQQTFQQLCTSATQVIGAGSDTTAITMRAFIYYTLTTPGVHDKLMAELDAAVDSRQIEFPVAYRNGVKLVYFNAVLKEVLRFFPAVPWLMPRSAPSGGATLGQHYFPAGTSVGMSAYCYHRRAFGTDSKTFRPERWLEASKEELSAMERNMLSFGGGKRACIGRNFSIMEMTKVLPTLFYHYNMSVIARGKGSPHKEPYGIGMDGKRNAEPWHVKAAWFAVQTDFFLNIEKRSRTENDNDLVEAT